MWQGNLLLACRLAYDAAEHGWSARDFHERCDGYGAAVRHLHSLITGGRIREMLDAFIRICVQLMLQSTCDRFFWTQIYVPRLASCLLDKQQISIGMTLQCRKETFLPNSPPDQSLQKRLVVRCALVMAMHAGSNCHYYWRSLARWIQPTRMDRQDLQGNSRLQTPDLHLPSCMLEVYNVHNVCMTGKMKVWQAV